MTTQDSCDLQTIMNKTGNAEYSQLASVMMIMKKMGSTEHCQFAESTIISKK